MSSIILVQPCGMSWEPGQKDMSRVANIMPPIGLCSLASQIEKHGQKASIYDLYALPDKEKQIIDNIKIEMSELIGFIATTSSFFEIYGELRGFPEEYKLSIFSYPKLS